MGIPFNDKLDRIGPVDNRPFTNYLHQFVKKKLKIIFSLIYINIKKKNKNKKKNGHVTGDR